MLVDTCLINILLLFLYLLVIFTEETKSCLFSNEDFIFYNINNTVKVSFLDSIDELTEISLYVTKIKFPIIYTPTSHTIIGSLSKFSKSISKSPSIPNSISITCSCTRI